MGAPPPPPKLHVPVRPRIVACSPERTRFSRARCAGGAWHQSVRALRRRMRPAGRISQPPSLDGMPLGACSARERGLGAVPPWDRGASCTLCPTVVLRSLGAVRRRPPPLAATPCSGVGAAGGACADRAWRAAGRRSTASRPRHHSSSDQQPRHHLSSRISSPAGSRTNSPLGLTAAFERRREAERLAANCRARTQVHKAGAGPGGWRG